MVSPYAVPAVRHPQGQNRKLCAAVGHLSRVNQRTGQLFTGGQVAEFHLAVHGDHVMRHRLRRTSAPVELLIQGIGHRSEANSAFSSSLSIRSASSSLMIMVGLDIFYSMSLMLRLTQKPIKENPRRLAARV
jgi:hypothetical protein